LRKLIAVKKGAAMWIFQRDCSVFSIKKAGLFLSRREVAEQKKGVEICDLGVFCIIFLYRELSREDTVF